MCILPFKENYDFSLDYKELESALNEYDFKYLPYVYMIQLARSTFGYSEYFKDTEKKDDYLEFAFYRTNICRDLYEKADEISKKLLELKKE